ncbi:MAG: peptide chain release factor-like protein [Acidobacteria bacterium]|nr:peptide chain release factor-like protein [Acidobacteriota bacterium]
MDETQRESGGIPSLEELEKEVEITVYQSHGPGGQHRNRTYSAVRVRHIPTGIIVTCADTRSQRRNRRIALERLRQKLIRLARRRRPRRPTRKPRSVRERELAAKKRRGHLKRLRSSSNDENL